MNPAASLVRAAPVRGWRISIRSIATAAALAAAVFVSGCATDENSQPRLTIAGHAVGANARFAVNDPDKLKPGTIFELFEKAQADAAEQSLSKALAEIGEKVGQSERSRKAVEAARALAEDASADDLAWLVAASLEGTLSTAINLSVIKDAGGAGFDRRRNLREPNVPVRLNPRKTRETNVIAAAVTHQLILRGAAEGLRDHAEPIDISGRYKVTVNAFCGISSGTYDLVQHGHVIEVVDDHRIVLYGAIGATRIHLVPNDRRYATVRATGDGGLRIDAPDHIAEILNGMLRPGSEKMTLVGLERPACAVQLRSNTVGA